MPMHPRDYLRQNLKYEGRLRVIRYIRAKLCRMKFGCKNRSLKGAADRAQNKDCFGKECPLYFCSDDSDVAWVIRQNKEFSALLREVLAATKWKEWDCRSEVPIESVIRVKDNPPKHKGDHCKWLPNMESIRGETMIVKKSQMALARVEAYHPGQNVTFWLHGMWFQVPA